MLFLLRKKKQAVGGCGSAGLQMGNRPVNKASMSPPALQIELAFYI